MFEVKHAAAKGSSAKKTTWSPALTDFNEVLVGLGQKPLDTASLELPSLAAYFPETATSKSSNSQAENASTTPRILFWYHPDYLGNVDLITERDGYAHEFFMYNPWGEEMHQWNANTYAFTSPYRFNSKELDPETGLAYYGARYYQNKLGVWLSIDPEAHLLPSWSPYVFSLNNPILFIDPDGQFPYTFHVRAFAPSGAFEGTGFHDDGRGFSTSTGVTSRIKQNFTVDPTARTFSGGTPTSDPTYWNDFNTGKATDKGGISTPEFGTNLFGSPTATLSSNFEGSNPAFAGLAPNIEVSSALSIAENLGKGHLFVSFDLSSKQFPATEGFVQDVMGNSVFLDGAAAYGSASNLVNADKKQVSTIDLIIGINDKGVFQNVTMSGKTYSLDEYNKLRTSMPAGPFPREN